MASDRLRKAKKTMHLRHSLPHVSVTAFTNIIKAATEMELSELPSSMAAYRRQRDLSLEPTPFGEVITKVTVVGLTPYPNREMHMLNPLAFLHTACKQGGGFYTMLRAQLAANPSTPVQPWRLLLYCDEVHPGNPLAHTHARKIWCIYASFLEFGLHLSNELSWIPMLCEPSNDIKKLSGTISQVMAEAMKLFFGKTFNLKHGGMQLEGPDGSSFRLWADMGLMVQDGGAHKLVWGCKGDGGSRLCMLCKNLVAEKAGLAGGSSGRLTDDLMDRSKLLFASNAEICATVRRLHAYKATCSNKDEFKLRQQAWGFTYQEHGVLEDNDLSEYVKPADQFVHDWQHGIFNNGMFNVLAYLFFNTIAKETKSLKIWRGFREYLNAWHFPRCLKFDPVKADIFSDTRIKSHKEAETVKMTASEGRCVLPVLSLFADMIGRGLGYPFAADALRALCDLVEALAASSLGLSTPSGMKRIVATLARSIKSAGWESELIPKFHWAVHYPDELERFGVNLTCWVHERKHKLAKRYGQNQTNMTAYPKAVLTEAVAHQLHDILDPTALQISHALVQPHRASQAIASFMQTQVGRSGVEVLAANQACVPPMSTIMRNDVVLVKSIDGSNFTAGQVWLLSSVESLGDFALVSSWELESRDKAEFAVWRMRDEPSLIRLELILVSVSWVEISPRRARTLIPFQYRGFDAVDS